jgi:thiol-disulfide isomerase/thioredoxin
MKNFKMMLFVGLLLFAASAISASAQDNMMHDHMMKVNPKNPTVAIIRADWCPYCRQLEPTMMDLMKEYEGKLNFVMLDVTNEETTAKAAAAAKSLGLTSFFEANKKKTSTVGIFKNKKQLFKTTNNQDRSAYVAAFDKALKS